MKILKHNDTPKHKKILKHRCKHCNEISGNKKFCCNGCMAAYGLIQKMNLKKYYDFCKKIYNSKPMKIENIINKIDYSEYIKESNDKIHNKIFEINLIVEGIHCGSCVWLIENTLSKQKNVLLAKVNLSTKKLKILWKNNSADCINGMDNIDNINNINNIDGAKNTVDHFIQLLNKIGYKLIPYNITDLENEKIKYEKNLLKYLIIAGFIWLQNMMISMGIWAADTTAVSATAAGVASEMGYYTQQFINIISATITIPGILYTAQPFFYSAINAIKNKRSNMDVPISLATFITLGMSIYSQVFDYFNISIYNYATDIGVSSNTYYEAVSGLIFALLIGKYLDIKTRNQAYSHVHDLLLSQVSCVTILNNDNKLELINIKNIKLGDTVVVTAGEKISVDGVIIYGNTEVDNSIINGESTPKYVDVGDYINAGTINLQNPIKIRVEKRAEDSVIANMLKLIEIAEQNRSKFVRISDKAAKLYTPMIFCISIITLIIWKFFIKNISWHSAIENAVSVLIITCPCALGLAVPVVQVIASSILIRNGIMPKTPDAIERISQINEIVFDKTGTLTEGRELMNSNDILSLSNNVKAFMLEICSKSQHPSSKSIAKVLNNIENKNNINIGGNIDVGEVKEESGYGIYGKNNDIIMYIGRKNWVLEKIDEDITKYNAKDTTEDVDFSLVYCAYKIIKTEITDTSKIKKTREELKEKLKEKSKELESIKFHIIKLLFKDTLKVEAKNMIDLLNKSYPYNISILSGDNINNVKNIAQELGVNEYIAEVNPIEKYNIIYAKNTNINHKIKTNVLMVGDGLNDSAALKIAHASMSPSSGIGIAQNCADIVFNGTLMAIPITLKIARKSQMLMKQNIIISFVYNAITIPIAMMGLVTPFAAAIVMSTSSIVVVLNSMRLKNKLRY